MTDKYCFLKEPWVSVRGQIALSLSNELKQELSEHHPLSGKALLAVARSEANDDVLYLDEQSGQYWLVHLTWTKETSDQYPLIKMFSSLEDFAVYCEATFQFYEDI